MSTRELWEQGKVTFAEERNLYDEGTLSECEFEFGPHTEHDDCERILADMSPEYPDESYGGYNDFETYNYFHGSSHIGFSVFE